MFHCYVQTLHNLDFTSPHALRFDPGRDSEGENERAVQGRLDEGLQCLHWQCWIINRGVGDDGELEGQWTVRVSEDETPMDDRGRRLMTMLDTSGMIVMNGLLIASRWMTV
jgi:hypothetical protein